MEDLPFQREFYLKLDKECQEVLDSCYMLVSQLNHYENDCGFELTSHVKEFKKYIFHMLKNYEER